MSEGSLLINDFSRIIFLNDGGPALPRRQRVRIVGFTGYDNGDEIVLSVNPRILSYTLGISGRPGVNDGEYVRTLAYQTNGDLGGAEFVYRHGVTSGADGYLKINTTDGLGQYQMLWDGATVDARWFGVVADADSSKDASNRAGINAALNALPSRGGVCLLPPGRVYIDDTITMKQGTTLEGYNWSPLNEPQTTLYWRKAGTQLNKVVIAPSGYTHIRGIGITIASGYIHGGIGYDFAVGEPLVTNCTVSDVTIGCYGLADAVNDMDHGITINTLKVAPGNLENIAFYNVGVSNPRHSHIRVGNNGGQMVSTFAERFSFIQNRGNDVIGAGAHSPYGYGIYNENQNFQITLVSPKAGSIGIFIRNASGEFPITVIDMDSEYMKKYLSGDAYAGGVQAMETIGGRFAVVGRPGVGAYRAGDAAGVPTLVAAANEDFVEDRLSRPIKFSTSRFDNNGGASGLRFNVGYGTPLILDGCYLPGDLVVVRQAQLAAENVGGTYARGCVNITAGHKVKDRHGPESYDGTVTITGAATTQVVTLPSTEAAATYRVYFTYVSETGAPAAGSRISPRSTLQTTTQFTAAVDTAPGGVATVTWAYRLELA